MKLRWALAWGFGLLTLGAAQAQDAPPQISLPRIGLRTQDLAVVINEADPASVETGEYYASQRSIAPEHVLRVSFPPGQAVMSMDDFQRVQRQLRDKLPAQVQAYALAWTLPYRVDCMSVTSAFAFGYDPAYCANGCQPTRPSRYFDSASNTPFQDNGLRPAMLLAGRDVGAVKALIDRGLRSDNQWPTGTAYLLNTTDKRRNVRAETYERARRRLIGGYRVERVDTDALQDKADVMFLFTGTQRVKGMDSNRYLDGAVADHLTSLGGMLTDSPQTSALEWLAAGATGSYGNTVEPCNYRAKFPDVTVLMSRYLGGETLIEAYWKSVLMPGQGVFIGDPLARPFGGVRYTRKGRQQQVQTHLLRPGQYALQAAASRVGPFRTIGRVRVGGPGSYDLGLPASDATFYRLLPLF
ncbi:MAG: TIGR03790 family protein [Cytophagales bacterium]|nr:TIGR03790 family protein [Rhizobacter sp.]